MVERAIKAKIKKNQKNCKFFSRNFKFFQGFLMSLIFFRIFLIYFKIFDFFRFLAYELYRSQPAAPRGWLLSSNTGKFKKIQNIQNFFSIFFKKNSVYLMFLIFLRFFDFFSKVSILRFFIFFRFFQPFSSLGASPAAAQWPHVARSYRVPMQPLRETGRVQGAAHHFFDMFRNRNQNNVFSDRQNCSSTTQLVRVNSLGASPRAAQRPREATP